LICGLFNEKSKRYFLKGDFWYRSFPILEDGEVRRLRVGFADPIAGRLVGIVIASILAIILIVCNHYFFNVVTSSYLDCLIALGMILASSFLGFLCAVSRNRSDACAISVDKNRRELMLPQQPDKTRPVIPFEAFAGLVLSQVVTHVDKKTGKQTINHILTLHYCAENEVKSAPIANGKTPTELVKLQKWILGELADGNR